MPPMALIIVACLIWYQRAKHKWAPKTYESNLSTIQNLIIPYIGSMEMQKLKPYHMENLYTTLSKTPCGSYIEGKKQELTEMNCPPFVRQYGILFRKWGVFVCQKRKNKRHIPENSKSKPLKQCEMKI